jgi:hypothetical protein
MRKEIMPKALRAYLSSALSPNLGGVTLHIIGICYYAYIFSMGGEREGS